MEKKISQRDQRKVKRVEVDEETYQQMRIIAAYERRRPGDVVRAVLRSYARWKVDGARWTPDDVDLS